MNGQERAEQNLVTFQSWAASQDEGTFRDMVVRGQLSRTEIAKVCGFAKSVLIQNPRVRAALKALEDELRTTGVLPPRAAEGGGDQPVSPPTPHASADQIRLKRLEAENAALRAELADLRERLQSYRVMEDVLSATGRLPR
ncbi:MAG: hypothetical protein EOM92_18435 [Gammaproteobacteria bacterium]|nr:hypothetical protein [Gammaproteobacteria bacterium]